MTTAAYPTVYAALVATATTALPTVRVVDGYDVSEDPGDVLMIGVPSLTDTTAIAAGSFNQVIATMGTPRSREETGTINGVVLAWNGDADSSAARLAAFAILGDLEDALRADPSLGVTAFARTVAQLETGAVAEDKLDGATCAISFTVIYAARI